MMLIVTNLENLQFYHLHMLLAKAIFMLCTLRVHLSGRVH